MGIAATLALESPPLASKAEIPHQTLSGGAGSRGEEPVFDKTIAAYLLLLADEILTVFSFGTGTTSVNDGRSRVKVDTVACKPLDFETEVDFGRVGKQGIRVERAVESLAGLLEVQEIAIVEMGCQLNGDIEG